ncbi:MAG TPA: DNA/RNA non-specific endonuclease, partial [Abditibacterium sp.]
NEDFRSDPDLPDDCKITDNDYSNSGYTRGHQCPSADRTSSVTLNKETFLMSNMLPQTAALNNNVWASFETYCNDLAENSGQELYIISGGVGSNGRIAGGKVNAPASCWKVAVILPKGTNDLSRINNNTRVISILMPNTTTVSGTYTSYYTTVDNIESLTGLDLLSNLPDSIENFLEASTSNR